MARGGREEFDARPPSADPARRAYEEGRALYLAGRFADALAAYERGLRQAPGFLRAHAAQVDTLLALDLTAQAESQAETLLDRYGSNTDLGVARAHAFLHRGRRLLEAGDLDAAAEQFEEAHRFLDIALTARPESRYARLRKGEAHLVRRRREALALAQECFLLAAREGDAEGPLEAAAACLDWGWYDEAARQLDVVSARAPDLAATWYWRGRVALAQRRRREAEAAFGRALQLDSAHAEARAALEDCRPSLWRRLRERLPTASGRARRRRRRAAPASGASGS